MQILLANPRGFCAGVERAIAIVERAIEKMCIRDRSSVIRHSINAKDINIALRLARSLSE